ncbi:hypothetical protein Z959_13275 [Clostridium novyi B str. ATCC 27606]|uniref:Uncharacterized protein n=1 Tax=Clostridium novyi B str. ATCC 27606 TaxID=1443123 RepID=A0AA40IRX5_CLONO|nr:hypothetical protein Z959_13275 [Clostridium novyi B str. ATCC 27606]
MLGGFVGNLTFLVFNFAQYLDINNYNLSFEYYENKYLKQGYKHDSLYEKILDSSTRSNKFVNKSLGIM